MADDRKRIDNQGGATGLASRHTREKPEAHSIEWVLFVPEVNLRSGPAERPGAWRL